MALGSEAMTMAARSLAASTRPPRGSFAAAGKSPLNVPSVPPECGLGENDAPEIRE